MEKDFPTVNTWLEQMNSMPAMKKVKAQRDEELAKLSRG